MKKIFFLLAITFTTTISFAQIDSAVSAKSKLYSDVATFIASQPGAKYTAEKTFYELEESEIKRYKKKVYLASADMTQWREHILQIGEKVITFKGEPYFSVTHNVALKEKPKPVVVKQPKKEKTPEEVAARQQIIVGVIQRAGEYLPMILQKRR